MSKPGDINPHGVDVHAARTIAMDFIRPYVQRGDSLEELTEGHMGAGNVSYLVQLGGCYRAFEKLRYFDRYKAVVLSIDCQECVLQFDIIDLINEIRQPAKQLSLF